MVLRALIAVPLAALGIAAAPAHACPCSSGDHQHGDHAAAPARAQTEAAVPVPQNAQVVELAVTKAGFEPAQVRVEAGRPVKLTVTRRVERTCATEIVMREYGINQSLPLGQPVTVIFTPKRPGNVRYACAMDMIAGELIVE